MAESASNQEEDLDEMDKSTPQYAFPSMIAAYGLALAPSYYKTLRMMAATGGKWSFSMFFSSFLVRLVLLACIT